MIIAPGYVNIPEISNSFQYRLIAFVGPAVNLLLWLVSAAILKYSHDLNRKSLAFLALTRRINMILFIFNMIPIGPLDGAKVFFGPNG
jgi:Zn-dependent protease